MSKLKSSYEVFEIPLKSISLDALQPRADAKKAKIESLAEDVKMRGQLIPIVVTPFYVQNDTLILGEKALKKEGHKFWLLDGERRYWALTSLGIKSASAIIRNDLTLLEMYEIQFVTGSKRIQVDKLEQAGAIERYRKELFKTDPTADVIKKLEQLTGFSYTHLKGADLINTVGKDTYKEIVSGTVGKNVPSEIYGVVTGKDKKSVKAVREGLFKITTRHAKVGKKHSALDYRAVKTELRDIVISSELTSKQKEKAAESTMEHFWSRRSNERDTKSDFRYYKTQAREFKRQIKKWNLESLKEHELDALASMLIELGEYFREERRKIFGTVGRRRVGVK